MSPLPISRSALDRLGERLVASEEINDEDYALLEQVLDAYQAALVAARTRLVSLGFEPTTRVKTTSVLIDKLRREGSMKLKGVQDIAGARIVADCTRTDQDLIAQRIVAAFADGARPPKVKDRRAEPVAGYRALHVIVTVDDLPVEVQVRTRWQDQWAQIVESLGDKWGRGIRYGEDPPEPDLPLFAGDDLSRRDLWEAAQALSSSIDFLEVAEVTARTVRVMLDQAPEPVRNDVRFAARVAEVEGLEEVLASRRGQTALTLDTVRLIVDALE